MDSTEITLPESDGMRDDPSLHVVHIDSGGDDDVATTVASYQREHVGVVVDQNVRHVAG